MKAELYLSPRERKELQAAVRERTISATGEHPHCEWCGQVNGKLKRNKEGYLVPQWLHTAHCKGALHLSKDPANYLCLCPRHHMAYDRIVDAAGIVSQYRQGYAVTTTDVLQHALAGVGLDIWGVVDEGWYWRMGDEQGGPEETPARATATAIARLCRLTSCVQYDSVMGGQNR